MLTDLKLCYCSQDTVLTAKKGGNLMINALLYEHFRHQQDILEGNTDIERVQSAYNWWANRRVITVITPKYIRIELPDKTKPRQNLISQYNDYKILKGLWVAVSDYGRDTDQFYWCRNWVQALIRKWICRARCSGPYLIHTIDLKGVD